MNHVRTPASSSGASWSGRGWRDNPLFLIAGPCAIESAEQTFTTARAVAAAGATMLRGGAFKPRTSPHSFQGLGKEGLAILTDAAAEVQLPFVTEVLDPRDVELVATHASMLQIGSRNMQNFALLREVGRSGHPVLLKRGLMATLDEWLSAAEHIAEAGGQDIVLCERGIRTFETYTRNTLDISAVPALRELTSLPIIVDPSHATGRPELIEPSSLAALAAGADGLMIEVHPNPEQALSDGDQALRPQQFAELARRSRNLVDFLTSQS